MRGIQELTHARMEPAIAGFPGLFQARTHGPDALDVRYQLGEVELRMLAAHRPRPADLLALAALVALAGPAGREPDVGGVDEALVGALAARPAEAAQGALVVRTTRARVLDECGLTDAGTTREALRESLTRLASLTAIARRGRQEVSMHLLSYAVDDATGELVVALSPRLARAILGGRHARLALNEMRELGEHAQVVYARLCAWIDPGATRRVGLAVLVEYLWSSREPQPSAGGSRKRRHLTRRALAQLGALAGWRVGRDARGVQYTITRPPVISGTRPVVLRTRAVVLGTPESAISV